MDTETPGETHSPDIERNFARLQDRFNEGDAAAALHALAHAYYFDVRPPQWAIAHVAAGYGRWHMAEIRSLDEALNVERPKGFRVDAAQRTLLYGGAILIAVNKRLESEAYDDEIFEDAGRPFGVGKTAAKEIYSEEMKYLKANHPETYQGIMSSRRSAKKPAVSKQRK